MHVRGSRKATEICYLPYKKARTRLGLRNLRMKGELTILGILMLAVAQWYASDSPRSRKIAYGLFGLAAAIAVVLVARGSV
jgi:di/tricarboxylate transporter